MYNAFMKKELTNLRIKIELEKLLHKAKKP